MPLKRFAALLCMAVLAALLPSCTTAPSRGQSGPAQARQVSVYPDLDAVYAGAKLNGGRVYVLSPEASDIRIFVFRGGRVPRLGHNHVLTAPRFDGRVYMPEAGPEHARFDLVFRLDQLQVDPPGILDVVGGDFATKLSQDDLAGVRAHMLGDSNMQADKYPLVRIHSLQVVGAVPALAVQVEIEMHGQRRDQWVPLQVHYSASQLSVSGRMVLSQTAFGVKPYSILGGLLAVQDRVVIEFRLLGSASG